VPARTSGECWESYFCFRCCADGWEESQTQVADAFSRAPDYKSIAEFRRVHRDAVTAAGAELVRMARQAGLVKGEWVAIDGSKFRAVSSTQAVPERESSEALPGSVGKRRSAGRSHY
jgi:hypothetical protein